MLRLWKELGDVTFCAWGAHRMGMGRGCYFGSLDWGRGEKGNGRHTWPVWDLSP